MNDQILKDTYNEVHLLTNKLIAEINDPVLSRKVNILFLDFLNSETTSKGIQKSNKIAAKITTLLTKNSAKLPKTDTLSKQEMIDNELIRVNRYIKSYPLIKCTFTSLRDSYGDNYVQNLKINLAKLSELKIKMYKEDLRQKLAYKQNTKLNNGFSGHHL
jgi:hypothetical protein